MSAIFWFFSDMFRCVVYEKNRDYLSKSHLSLKSATNKIVKILKIKFDWKNAEFVRIAAMICP